MDKKLLFVHIPKTAGTSIQKCINKKYGDFGWKRTWWMDHDPFHVLKQNNVIDQNTFTFSVVRNPYTRFYSYYSYLKRNKQRFNIDFLEYTKIAKEAIENRDENKKKSLLVKYDQSYYIFENEKTELDKIYRYENLQELEKDLNISLPNFNVGVYSKEQYNTEYTEEVKDLVRKMYARDFKLLGYSQEFV